MILFLNLFLFIIKTPNFYLNQRHFQSLYKKTADENSTNAVIGIPIISGIIPNVNEYRPAIKNINELNHSKIFNIALSHSSLTLSPIALLRSFVAGYPINIIAAFASIFPSNPKIGLLNIKLSKPAIKYIIEMPSDNIFDNRMIVFFTLILSLPKYTDAVILIDKFHFPAG